MEILIIEDCKAERHFFVKCIKEIDLPEEMNIDECSNLTESLTCVSQNDYDLIILDLTLPDAEGIETISTMLSHLETCNKRIPIIILTGSEDLEIGKRAFKLGIKDYLYKDDTHKKELQRAVIFATYSNYLPQRKIAKA